MTPHSMSSDLVKINPVKTTIIFLLDDVVILEFRHEAIYATV